MRPTVRAILGTLLLLAPTWAAHAGIGLADDGRLTLSGDFRLRFEADWDSQRANGSERDDRNRARIRGRLGLTYKATDAWTLGLRARTGSRDSQQSPHITIYDFDDNPKGDRDALFDKWYVGFQSKRTRVWAGRNGFPFWRPHEIFWDDDVTPVGVALSYDPVVGDSKLTFTGGYFKLPDGAVDFGPEMGAAQLVYSTSTGAPDFTVAGGFYSIRGTDDIEHLRRGNGSRDYSIWTGNLQARLASGKHPFTLGLDLLYNSESYSADDPDPFTAANHDQTDGWSAYASWGATKKKGDWLLAVFYAHIETLALNASYAQDDWVRWGSATQTDSSDFEGFELRAVHALGKKMNLVARLYLVDAITSGQNGNRFRLDYNMKF